MNTDILSKDKDPMGAAILDYQKSGKAGRLRVLSSMFEEDEMPVKHLFRNLEEMPFLEQKALKLAKGKVLDVGAGAGCHALALQKECSTKDASARQEKAAEKQDISSVKAIDISPLSCEAMRLRGVKDTECINLFDEHLETGFDTILLLMNGTGIAGKIEHLPTLFNRLKALLNKGGQILGAYYGEVDYQMIYKDIKGDRFDWLYVDYPLLKSIAESCGLHGELVAEGEHYDYLARIF